ncbi:aspartate kinase [Peptoclostridium litorale DSM 5388]|uniref:Aspartokinase n=1 Tax=Peptoclostridium litorale DSM 5388 TaxID=1121324 RepID=A0A069RDR8_PEPLI|nr:aspartate kinase [Peptoclostridium litorale]KDR95214.1 aspartokinase 1 [Peptoclostridium litorale DSM 5388]SIN73298.1 aspartate kinase [Peptoclostridium litorale DSM 5388]
MDILVKKFGGTSLADIEKMKKVADLIKRDLDNGKSVVTVVSAMGRRGNPYATDSLIDMCKQACKAGVSPREMDILMSCGEIVSGSVLVHVLKEMDIEATLLTGGQAGIITDDNYGSANVVEVNPKRILTELENGRVVIITGFQGISREGEITTLGRGGSDTSAVIVGDALCVDTVEIYTDVDGIMTADPKIQPNAKTIQNINYDEVFQMAEKGAKVIHPRAVEIAKSSNILLKIKNTLKESEGTSICYSRGKDTYNSQKKSLITAVAYKEGITQVVAQNSDMLQFSKVLDQLRESGVSIDMINFFVSQKVFTIDSENVQKTRSVFGQHEMKYEIVEECCKVTVIGERMTGIPGVMSKVVAALNKANVEILQTSDSHMTISCLVKKDDLKKAVNSLHDEFMLSK